MAGRFGLRESLFGTATAEFAGVRRKRSLSAAFRASAPREFAERLIVFVSLHHPGEIDRA